MIKTSDTASDAKLFSLMTEDAECALSMVDNAMALLSHAELLLVCELADESLKAPAATVGLEPRFRRHCTEAFSPAFCLIVLAALRWLASAREAKYLLRRADATRSLIHLRERAECARLGGRPIAAPPDAIRPFDELGRYIQLSYEWVAGRAARAAEIASWLAAIQSNRSNVGAMQAGLLREAAAHSLANEQLVPHISDSCWVMGTGRHLTLQQWNAQVTAKPPIPVVPPKSAYEHRFSVRGGPRPLVSALLSLWGGNAHIRRFMQNITTQDGFTDYCELVIIDAASLDQEIDVIRPYLEIYQNIKYERCDERVSVYEAWNRAIELASGKYITNTNVDDLRRHDSLMLQAGVLENLPFVDVVYQDFFYTLDPNLSFEEIAVFGHVSNLPAVTQHSLLQFNSPHNAPMWRHRLHDELGLFDTSYQSAADYEFWLRCVAAGKEFYKLNDPHVVYFHNPEGISTRPGTRGPAEGRAVAKTYARRLIPDDVTVSDIEFIDRLGNSVAATEQHDGRYRYALAQGALRNTARCGKYATASSSP